MELVDVLHRGGGILPTRAVRAAGFSERAIRQALATQQIHRVRKGWIALAEVDRSVVLAVRAHGILSCISEAARLGLWVMSDGRVHIAAAPHAGGIRANGCVVHWGTPALPRDPDAAVDSLENSLLLIAECQSHENAVTIWESALRKSLITPETMRHFPLSARMRAVLDAAGPWSDSGLESLVLSRLRFLRVDVRQQIVIAGRAVDFLIGDRLVLQVDGGHHVGEQRDKDISHDALLMTMGYTVVRVSYVQVVNQWPAVQHRIMLAIAQGKHLAA